MHDGPLLPEELELGSELLELELSGGPLLESCPLLLVGPELL
jgi:hypothetical protein